MIHPSIQILANKIRENPQSFVNTKSWDDTWTRIARKYDIIFTDEERKIIEEFKKKYLLRRDIGLEYFEGNYREMIDDINTIIKEHGYGMNIHKKNKKFIFL